MDTIEVLKSKNKKLEIEKSYLMDRLDEILSAKHSHINARNSKQVLMEYNAKMQREQNEIDGLIKEHNQKEKHYQDIITHLNEQIEELMADKMALSDELEKEQNDMRKFKQEAKRREAEILKANEHSIEMQEAMHVQKAYIEKLQDENERLIADKHNDDNAMFSELQQLKNTKFARSVRNLHSMLPRQTTQNIFKSIDLENELWRKSALTDHTIDEDGYFDLNQLDIGVEPERVSLYFSGASTRNNSTFSNVGTATTLSVLPSQESIDLIIEHKNKQRSGIVPLYEHDVCQFVDVNGYSITTINTDASMKTEEETKSEEMETPVPNMDDKVNSAKSYKSVNLKVPNQTLHKIKESMDQEAKLADMEMDFFLLTCIAVKANLFEEYPESNVMSEDIMKMFVMAQKEGLEMRKFNLWIELQLRHKYDLGKLRGFKKFAKRYNIVEEAVDAIKEKAKHFKKLAKYGHNYEVPEMIRKYAKHKGKDEVKARDYLNRIGAWSDNLLQEFEHKNEEYFDGFYGDSESAETQFFRDLFMEICKFFYCTRLLGATFGEFAVDIERIFDGMPCSKIRVDEFVSNDVWTELYGNKLLFVVDVMNGKLLQINPLIQSFCNKSIGFMRSCLKHKGDYAAFSGNLSHYICQYLVEEDVIDFEDADIDKDELIGDILGEFMKILNDKKNFARTLFRSIEKNISSKLSSNSNTMSPLTPTEIEITLNQNEYQRLMDDLNVIEVYEQILAVIIINMYYLKDIDVEFNPDGRIYRSVLKEIEKRMESVLQKCEDLNVDERTKTMIRYFFAYHFQGEPEFDGVCSTGNLGCIIQ